MTLYAQRNPRTLEPHLSRHMEAMTSEGLHDKGNIASELAWRDAEIERLRNTPCPNVITSAEGTSYCALAEATIKERDTKIEQLRTENKILFNLKLLQEEQFRYEIEQLTAALREIQCACIAPRPGVIDTVREIACAALTGKKTEHETN
jgi:hypothetical protein